MKFSDEKLYIKMFNNLLFLTENFLFLICESIEIVAEVFEGFKAFDL